jgi:hypothetical protein
LARINKLKKSKKIFFSTFFYFFWNGIVIETIYWHTGQLEGQQRRRSGGGVLKTQVFKTFLQILPKLFPKKLAKNHQFKVKIVLAICLFISDGRN